MLKILLAHNDYGSAAPSGENQVFDAERALLQQHGHTVETFTRHSDEIRNQGTWGAVKGACAVESVVSHRHPPRRGRFSACRGACPQHLSADLARPLSRHRPPREWFKGFPMVVREAFAFGTPTAVSAIGPLPSLVRPGENGVLFAPANPESLFHKVRTAWETPGLLEQLGQGARQAFEARYTEDANVQTLMTIYQQAIAVSQERKGER